MQRVLLALTVTIVLGIFWWLTSPEPEAPMIEEHIPWEKFWSAGVEAVLPVAETFSLPLFPPDGDGAYVKRSFGEKQNLGEDWGLEPENKAQDVEVFAVADGMVILADDFGSVWGKVVIILHRMPNGSRWLAVESMYANLAVLKVKKGEIIAKGTPIGSLGRTQVSEAPELHFEMRTEIGHMLGPGEADQVEGWVNPTRFIEEHKK